MAHLVCLQKQELLSVFLDIESKLISLLAGNTAITLPGYGVVIFFYDNVAMSCQGVKINCSKLLQYGETLKVRVTAIACFWVRRQ